MIQVRNKAALSKPISIPVGTTIVPFDTLVCDTNGSMSWNAASNAVNMEQCGRYNTSCTAVLSAAVSGTVTLALLANGNALEGDFVSAVIPDDGTAPLVLSVPVAVAKTAGSTAYLQWAITTTAAVTLSNAFASVQKIQ